jgi:hypothetical protein
MDIKQITADRTIQLMLTRGEARDILDHLRQADWNSLDDTTRALFHFLDMALAPDRR